MLDDIEIEINAILLKNRNILKFNHDAEKIKIHKSELIQQDFIFSHYTSEMKHQDKDQIFKFVYDFGIGKLANDYFEIVRIPF